MTFVYDAGVLIAAERSDRAVWANHRAALERGDVPVTTAPVVAQVNRAGHQAQLRRFLRGCEVVPFAAHQAHRVGALLTATGSADVVDAHLVEVAAAMGRTVVTSDAGDLEPLAAAHGSPVRVRVLC